MRATPEPWYIEPEGWEELINSFDLEPKELTEADIELMTDALSKTTDWKEDRLIERKLKEKRSPTQSL